MDEIDLKYLQAVEQDDDGKISDYTGYSPR